MKIIKDLFLVCIKTHQHATLTSTQWRQIHKSYNYYRILSYNFFTLLPSESSENKTKNIFPTHKTLIFILFFNFLLARYKDASYFLSFLHSFISHDTHMQLREGYEKKNRAWSKSIAITHSREREKSVSWHNNAHTFVLYCY